ncbi:unnamed protein product [Mucor hiemalis]
MEMPNQIEAQKRQKVSRFNTNNQPRWHNQAYMLYLALRQHTSKTMARTDLIKSALAIDKRISEERFLPKVFRGKTPMNSASAILTNNSDCYFIPFKPEGSKSMHFRFSFEPGNYESALKEYTQWQEDLMENDWPSYFGVKKSAIMSENTVKELEVTTKYPTEFDEFIAKRKRERLEREGEKENCTQSTKHYNYIKEYSPKSWQEVVSLRKSNQYGLFANRYLPKNIPLGFYFGVPLTEDEFDSMKDGVGQAAELSYMYKNRTVIDPTDESGKFYELNGNPLCPFHFIKETMSPEKANVAFYEGNALNQIVCWTKKDISAGDELFVFSASSHTNSTNTTIIPQNTPILRPVPIAPTPIRNNIPSSPQNTNSWQKKPSISSMLNTTIPTI